MKEAMQPVSKPQSTSSFAPVNRGFLQRRCGCGGSPRVGGDCSLDRLTIRRATDDRAFGTSASAGVPSIVQDVLRSSGQPLDNDTRAFMEARFGHNFSSVRVHTDGKAVQSAQAVSALAYTVGPDIVLGDGQLSTRSKHGRRLLAHELAHVVQQGGQAPSSSANLEVGEPEDSFEREADSVADRIMADDREFRLLIADEGTSFEGQPYEQGLRLEGQVGTGPVSLAPNSPVLRRTPIIQRIAAFTAGAVHNVWNLAQRLAGGAMQGGFTPPTLNGTQILSAATSVASINRPVLGGRSTATGTESWVNSVPTNTGSYDMTLPASGPWSTVTPKMNVAGLLHAPACAVAGDTTFSVHGLPTDTDFLTDATTHEQHHATDHEAVFNRIAVPWDAALTTAMTSHQIFGGPDITTSEANLYAAMGGTPDSIATDLHNNWIAANNAFHGTPAGRSASLSSRTADATCSVSSVDVRV